MSAGNQHTEYWTIEKAIELFDKCISTAKDRSIEDNDFIGEVAQINDSYLTQLDYLKGKFPELEVKYKEIKSHCEANCFRNGKKQNIVPSMAIMNLKSNHGWTDRVDTTTKGESVKDDKPLTKEEIDSALEDDC